MFEWVLIYGYGTPSAYVRRMVRDRESADLALGQAQRTWGRESSRFSIHPYADVVSRETPDSIVLKPAAKRGGSSAARPPLGPTTAKKPPPRLSRPFHRGAKEAS